MDSAILCFGLLCVLNAWAVSFALRCEGDKYQNAKGDCCDPCPKGEYVEEECSASKLTSCSPCKTGTYWETINPHHQCASCLTCSNNTVEPCTPTTKAKCSCSEGYICSDKHCAKCEVKKTCLLGEILHRKGNIEFSYKCEPCPDNTFFDTNEGLCKPLTRCSDNGLVTVFPGNKTHNSRCSIYDAGQPLKDNANIIVITLACSVLLLFLLYACVKKTIKHKHANNIAVFAPVVSTFTPEYPFPKEECGEKFGHGSSYDVVPG